MFPCTVKIPSELTNHDGIKKKISPSPKINKQKNNLAMVYLNSPDKIEEIQLLSELLPVSILIVAASIS